MTAKDMHIGKALMQTLTMNNEYKTFTWKVIFTQVLWNAVHVAEGTLTPPQDDDPGEADAVTDALRKRAATYDHHNGVLYSFKGGGGHVGRSRETKAQRNARVVAPASECYCGGKTGHLARDRPLLRGKKGKTKAARHDSLDDWTPRLDDGVGYKF